MKGSARSGLRRRRVAVRFLIGVAVACLLALAGSTLQRATAGSSTQSAATPPGVAGAKVLVKKYEAPQTKLQAPGPAFNANTTKVRGKRVFWLEISAANPYTTTLLSYWKPVAKILGLEVTYFDGKGDPSEFIRGINQAIAGHYDVIVNQAGPPAIFPYLAKAHKAGIKVVNFYTRENGGKANIPGTTDGDLEYCLTCFGRIIADYAIAQSNGHVNGVVLASPDIGISPDYTRGLLGELKKRCPKTCKAKVQNIVVADWQTKTPTLTSTIVSDTSVNYLFPLFDALTNYMITPIHAANAQRRVKIVTIDGNVGPMGFLKKGDVIAGDLGESISGNAWAIGDQIARLLSGQKPSAAAGPSVALRLFTRRNVGSINLSAPQDQWFGRLNLKSKFLKLWGFRK